jgi:YgiT-type zinc finger domain-containing protein
MQEAEMVCDICGKEGARIRRVTRSYGKGCNLLVIENVPIINCPHCGESYLTAETLHEIEKTTSSEFCGGAWCIVVNYSENDRIKADSEQTHESDCIHRIRLARCS